MSEPLRRCKRCGMTKHRDFRCHHCWRLGLHDDERERHGRVALVAGLAQESARRREAAKDAIRRMQ